MKFSENWLREIIDPPINTARLAQQLNLLGLEVDNIEPAAPEFTDVVVAKICDIQSHPDADRLRICTVNTGESQSYQVVCGASNAAIGLVVPLAKVGARLPGNVQIKKSKLRGVESFGMLCSAVELGLADKADGLFELPSNAPPGVCLRDYLLLNDNLIEIDLTPNRSDCLSITGVAREVAVANEQQLALPETISIAPEIEDVLTVHIDSPEACPRYVGRIIKGINNINARTPHWMVEKLRRSGIRSNHPVVDITNYVMLELGQPMHAFDLGKLHDSINVRYALPDESIVLLDGTEVTLAQDTLLISDSQAACAIAGIMGGANSSVSDSTQDIFLESAFFTPASIIGRSRNYGLHTDSSHRFERGVDPSLQSKAMQRATELLIEVVGGKAGPLIDEQYEEFIPVPQPIILRANSIQRVLGCQLANIEVRSILERLGNIVKPIESGWEVLPPCHRFDLKIEVDLIEELARVYGYTNLPRKLPEFTPKQPQALDARQKLDDLKVALTQQGYHEVVCYSFIDPQLQQLIEPDRSALKLSNPISSEFSVMRTSLLAGLLNVLQHNIYRQQKELRVFEVGSRYIMQGDDIQEKELIGGVSCGPRHSEAWNIPTQSLDFYDVKGDVEKLMEMLGETDIEFRPMEHSALHPGQSGQIYLRQEPVGWLGRVHPKIQQHMGVSEDIFMFELNVKPLLSEKLPQFAPISKFPSIRRDIAIEVDSVHNWEAVESCIRQGAPEYLVEIRLFDVYAGKGVTSGRKSLAIGLILQEISRTLTDTEITSSVDKILGTLNKNLGATLRE